MVIFASFLPSQGLWVEFKEKTVEPIIDFQNEFILQTNSDSSNAFFSTLETQQELNSVMPSALAISTYKIDYDKNNKPELIHLHLTLNKNSDLELIKGISLILLFDYKFKGEINLKTKSMVRLHAESPHGIQKVYMTGSIQFSQRTLLIQGTVPDERYNESIFSSQEQYQYEMLDILSQYNERNFTTYADYSKLIFPDQNQNQVDIFIDLNIPQIETIDYSPPLIEKVKFAWIQYFSLFLPLYYILGTLLSFILKEQIAVSIETNNIQNEF